MLRGILKKSILCVLIAALLLTVPAFAETAVVTPAKGVNMRVGPGTEYKVVAKLPCGTEVQVTSSTGSWYSVIYNGTPGYISSPYLKLDGTVPQTVPAAGGMSSGITAANGTSPSIFINGAVSQTAPVQQVQPVNQYPVQQTQPMQQIQVSSAATGAGIISGDYVRLRTGPSTSYTIIATLRKGTSVSTEGTYGDWTKCTVGGQTGFVSSKYVSAYGAYSSSTGTYYSAAASAQSGAAPSIFINGASGQTAPAQQVQPATQYQVQQPAGAQQTQTQIWAQQQAQQNAAGAQTGTQGNAPQSFSVMKVAQTLGYITGNHVRFRAAPSTSAEIIGEFQYGNSIYITGITGDWTAATAGGKSGFVFSQYVREGTYTAPSAAESVSAAQQSAPAQSQTATAAPAQQKVFTPVTGDEVAALALSYVGTQYIWGGDTPDGFDCSGFVGFIYSQFGMSLNRTAASMATNGVSVPASDMKPGDILCFYTTSSSIGHVGIYIGNDQFVHASNHITGVIVTNLSTYRNLYGFEVRRIIT